MGLMAEFVAFRRGPGESFHPANGRRVTPTCKHRVVSLGAQPISAKSFLPVVDDQRGVRKRWVSSEGD